MSIFKNIADRIITPKNAMQDQADLSNLMNLAMAAMADDADPFNKVATQVQKLIPDDKQDEAVLFFASHLKALNAVRSAM